MKLEFQKDVLKFLCQHTGGKMYVELIDEDFFDSAEEHTAFQILKSFVKEYKSQPSLGNFLEFFRTKVKEQKNKVSSDVLDALERTIREAYRPFTANVDHIKDVLLEEYQLKLMRDMLMDVSASVRDKSPGVLDEIYRKVDRIRKLSDTALDDAEKNKGTFLIADHKEDDYSVVEGHATQYSDLNRMTSVKGFYSPQLIIFMAGPKGFKTGLLLNILKGYVQDGYKVYLADAENGHLRMKDRVRQSMLKCTFDELRSGSQDGVLTEMVGRYKALGGDMKIDYYPAYTKSLSDVDDELEYLRDELGWVPDIIAYDYLDLFNPIDYKIHEKRLKIQAVYFDAINLNNKWGTIGFSLSQVNKNALSQTEFSMTAFAEDFGKAMNAHGCFGLNRDDIEKAAGIGRIVVVMQRDGVPQHKRRVCFVQIDEERMSVDQISHAKWKILYESEEAKRKNKKPIKAKTVRSVRPTKIKDE